MNQENRKNLEINWKINRMILAVSANRMIKHWGFRYFYKTHKKVVDKRHIDWCKLLKQEKQPTHFSKILMEAIFYDLKEKDLIEIKQYLENLSNKIKNREERKHHRCARLRI